jgi:hypothetical protein
MVTTASEREHQCARRAHVADTHARSQHMATHTEAQHAAGDVCVEHLAGQAAYALVPSLVNWTR